MAIQYRNMNGNEFLRALSRGETSLQGILLPDGTDFSKIKTFAETMGALRQKTGYRPDLSGLVARQLTAYDHEYYTGLYLPHAILSGADLGRADLRKADLRKADLEGAYLRGAYLRGADLGGANFEGADIWGADIWGANLWRANLSHIVNATAEQLSTAFLRYIRTTDPAIRKLVMKAYTLQREQLFDR